MSASYAPSTNLPPTRITVLISGNGSNLQALIDASSTNLLQNTSIVRVISNKKSAYGLTRAQSAGIPTKYHNLISGKYLASGEKSEEVKQKARVAYDADLAKIVLEDKPDLVVCAGWMHILAPSFLDPLKEADVPVINLHPALPGEYDGANAIQRAYEDFQKGTLKEGRTGIMVHYVISEVDRGTPLLVREVQCKEGESLDELEQRIHNEEHDLIVKGTAQAIVELLESRRKKSA
jgi:phosphoribosylglycinamide formyltransferase